MDLNIERNDLRYEIAFSDEGLRELKQFFMIKVP